MRFYERRKIQTRRRGNILHVSWIVGNNNVNHLVSSLPCAVLIKFLEEINVKENEFQDSLIPFITDELQSFSSRKILDRFQLPRFFKDDAITSDFIFRGRYFFKQPPSHNFSVLSQSINPIEFYFVQSEISAVKSLYPDTYTNEIDSLTRSQFEALLTDNTQVEEYLEYYHKLDEFISTDEDYFNLSVGLELGEPRVAILRF